jgi:nitrite reductase/ring-hydroxylating ferredoxin subunit
VAYDIVGEASPRPARRYRAAASKTPIAGGTLMNVPNTDFTLAGTLEELKAKGRLVVHGAHRPILVVHDRGGVFALDNRCPHMGFPLDRGSVEDGILTCHWHHARFDLESGCTFDLWADDTPTFPVELRNDEVWVRTTFEHADPAAHWRQRLNDGLAHDIGLVIAKAVQGQLAAGVSKADVVRQATLFGAQNRDGWGVGLTILTALANLLPGLPEDEAYLALFHGARRVASDCGGQPPRRERAPLESRLEPATLKRWLRRWTKVRHREAAERTLLTGIAAGLTPAVLADALLAAETERAFADVGHSLDFINKSLECLDLIGWEHASSLLPSVVGQMVAARGAEESTEWRQPVDLVALCDEAAGQMPELFAANSRASGSAHHAALALELLGDDPAGIVDAIKRAVFQGAVPTDLGRSLAYGRLFAWPASATPTSTPTGRRRITSSPTPTRSTGCSSGSDALPRVATSPPFGVSCTARWLSISHATSMSLRPAFQARATSSPTICLPMRRRSGSPCSTPSTARDRSILRPGSWRGISSSAIRRRR